MSNFHGPRGIADLITLIGPLFFLAGAGVLALLGVIGYGVWWLLSHLAWV